VKASSGCRSQLVTFERRAGGAGGSMCSDIAVPSPPPTTPHVDDVTCSQCS
jgi:hypothetical protein